MRKPAEKNNPNASGNSWPVVTLGDLIAEFRGGFSLETDGDISCEDEIGMLKVSAVNSGRFFPLEAKRIPTELIRLAITPVKRDRVIINRSNTPELVGACGYASRNYDNLFLPDTLWQMEPRDPEELDSQWLAYLLSSEPFRQKLSRLASGTSGSMKKLSRGSIETLELPLPPKSYQTKAANILSRWDDIILLLERSIIIKKKRKRGLMQRLLTGKTRMQGFKKSPWKTFRLGDLFVSRDECNRLDLPLLSITANEGIVHRDTLVKKDTSNADKSKYLRICPGDIGYNTMRMWQGVSALSRHEGIISPAYTVCVPNKNILGNFAAHLFKYSPVIHLFRRYSQGLVDDTLGLKFYNFAEIKVTIPVNTEEQQAIANILELCDREIILLTEKHDALERQKRGLMQKLLTGGTRIKTAKEVA